ncbi:presequence protease [Anaeramoeba flamelloides]|uniref:Presequence protease n=1 Tax=Anaeramoeba flamelloides TaxID=1746091 RepID=A0AAV7Z304_9EUKA|nr:presequence protease [Anaeramoeba flamelloides]
MTTNWEILEEFDLNKEVNVQKYFSTKTGMTTVFINSPGPIINGSLIIATPVNDNAGLPHIIEHMVYSGSEDYPYPKFLDEFIKRCYGSDCNGETEIDYTNFQLTTVDSKGFLTALPVYLDHIFFPLFSESFFLTEIYHIDEEGKENGVVFNEEKMTESTSDEILEREVKKLLYKDTPFEYESGGLTNEIRNVTLEQVKKYHKSYYLPQNMVMFFSGTISPNDVFQSLEEIENKILNKTQKIQPLTFPLNPRMEMAFKQNSCTKTIKFPSSKIKINLEQEQEKEKEKEKNKKSHRKKKKTEKKKKKKKKRKKYSSDYSSSEETSSDYLSSSEETPSDYSSSTLSSSSSIEEKSRYKSRKKPRKKSSQEYDLDDKDDCMVKIGYLIEKHSKIEEYYAHTIIWEYLIESGVSPVTIKMAESHTKYCSDISFDFFNYSMNSCILTFQGVNKDYLENIETELRKIITKEISYGIEKKDMKEIIESKIIYTLNELENIDLDLFTEIIANNFLYSSRENSNLEHLLNPIYIYEKMLSKPSRYWEKILKDINGRQFITICGKPSKKLQIKVTNEENARINNFLKRNDYNDLQKIKHRLNLAKSENRKQFPIESFQTIHFPKIPKIEQFKILKVIWNEDILRNNVSMERKKETEMEKDKEKIINYMINNNSNFDYHNKIFPFHLQFNHCTSTEFVYIDISIDTSDLANELRPYLFLFCQTFFVQPIKINGKKYNDVKVEQNIKKYSLDSTINIGFDNSIDFEFGEFGQLLLICIKSKIKDYENILEWLKRLIWYSETSHTIIEEGCEDLLDDLNDSNPKEEDFSITKSVLNYNLFDKNRSNIVANGIINQARFLKKLLKNCKKDKKYAVQKYKEILNSLFSDITKFKIQVSSNLLKLTKHLDVWTKNNFFPKRLFREYNLNLINKNIDIQNEILLKINNNFKDDCSFYTSKLRILSHLKDEEIIDIDDDDDDDSDNDQIKEEKMEGYEDDEIKNKQPIITVVGTPDVDASNFIISIPIKDNSQINKNSHLLNVFIELLNSTRGPFWKQIRGQGYAYDVEITQEIEKGYLYVYIGGAQKPIKALDTIILIFEQLVNKTIKFDDEDIKTAVCSAYQKFVNEQDILENAFFFNFKSLFYNHRDIDKTYQLLQSVSKENINSLITRYFSDFFSPSTNIAILVNSNYTQNIKMELEEIEMECKIFQNISEIN